jgi:glucokinase
VEKINLDSKFNSYIDNISDFNYYVLGADIGGTNTNISIAGIKDSKIKMIFSFEYNSKKINSIIPPIKQCLEYAKNKYNIEAKKACFGVAGIVNQNKSAKLTNADWSINSNQILEKTALEEVALINDFQAIGYGVNNIDFKNDIICVNGNIKKSKKTKAIIGAGTGLGKTILVYNNQSDYYKPISSEGGHSDFPAYTNYELRLLNFIKKYRNLKNPVYYEEILSGRGIENIYYFLKKSEKEISNFSSEIENADDIAEKISKLKNKDETCKKVFDLFSKFYGRCAKNYVLDTLAIGGLFIAGGIARKNKEIFKSNYFLEEFFNGYEGTNVLRETPIYVITDKNIGIKGTFFVAMKNLLEKKND